MKKQSWSFILFTLLGCVQWLQAQQFQLRNYSVREGIGQSQVFALCQDSRGYLWIGTRGGGLTRFDGTTFRHYTTREGLGNNFIYCIKEAENGDIWVGTNHGLSRFDGNKFTNYYLRDRSSPVEVLEFYLMPGGLTYLATLSGLYSFDGSKFRLLSEAHVPVNTLCPDPANNRIWFGNARGLYAWEPETGRTSFFLKKTYINKVSMGPGGKIWVGTYGDGVYVGNIKGFKPFMPVRTMGFQEIFEIYHDTRGNVWFGTLKNGIYRYDTLSRNLLQISDREGLSNNHVRCIISDREGNYWFGTSGGGMCQYFGLPFTHFDRESGLKNPFIYAVFADAKNRLWIGTGDAGVTLLDSGKFKNFGAKEGFINTKVKAIGEDAEGRIYLGTEGDGLYVYEDEKFELIPALRKKFIRSIVRDADQNMWIATAGMGLYKISRGEKNKDNYVIKNYTADDILLHNRLSALIHTGENQIWYATENSGIGMLENGKPVAVSTGLKGGIPLVNVRCLAADANGDIWAGTGGDGIFHYAVKGGKATLVADSFKQLLTSLNVYLIAFDKKGNLFVGSESGLDYIELDKNRHPLSLKHFGKNEGFVGIETCQNAVTIGQAGNLWFGTINGLTRCNPAYFTRNPFPPSTGISGIRLFYKELSQTRWADAQGPWGKVEKLVLPYDQNHLTFDLRAISFSNPEQVRFSWKLQGFDANWSPESDGKSVTYSNIPPGEYTFLVKARNGDGVWNPAPVSVRITITAPYWQRLWFRILVIALFLGLVVLVFRLRVSGLKKKASKAQEKLMQDKKLADLEHQALRLQMNPHFIFNALNSIQSQIGEQNEQKARYYLAKFGRLMRQILDNSRKPLITLKEELETLENYLLVEKFSSGDTFDYEIKVDENMDTDFIKIPPMLLQPFAENSIKHGFKNLSSRRGKIILEFKEEGHFLCCVIADNGVGRELGTRRAESEGESYHESTALRVIRERLALMDEKTDQAAFTIKDIKGDGGEPLGTTIEIRIPI